MDYPCSIRCVTLVLILILTGTTRGQESQTSPAAPDTVTETAGTVVAKAAPTGVRRALIICGLAGDADHNKLFGESVVMLHTGLVANLGFSAENIRLLWGEKPTEKDPAVVRSCRDVATRETVAAHVDALRGELRPEDALWVIVLGHAHFDGRSSWLNLTGSDLNHLEFGRMFENVRCQEQVFFITTPCSGYYLKPLAQAGRVVISATESDLEVNETLFPHQLARVIASPPAATEFDMDQDGELTVFDLYLWTVRATSREYAAGELLATEHALLDDSGDGRGTEVQSEYFTEELGGRRRPTTTRVAPPKGDGNRSRQVTLTLPLSVTRPASPAAPPLPIDF